MLKEKLGLCLYEVICDEQEFILMPEVKDDTKQLKKENKEPKEIKISEEIKEKKISEEPKEINSPEKDENTTNWYDKSNFKKILAIIEFIK